MLVLPWNFGQLLFMSRDSPHFIYSPLRDVLEHNKNASIWMRFQVWKRSGNNLSSWVTKMLFICFQGLWPYCMTKQLYKLKQFLMKKGGYIRLTQLRGSWSENWAVGVSVSWFDYFNSTGSFDSFLKGYDKKVWSFDYLNIVDIDIYFV